ncbi:hypothetical protein ETH_00017300 [Eimeria tenella]|uniref:Uncharacterized protein n=1 Tax=Eimeria tenella TaxID=5802 RepID=U6KY34_EIMTE|nr:hypothetical protein ETH_00017300 [Eimeria tenella]CDJ42876.1 hypothetical protein ETH_00017300 [Eimeria tenella]|eukprot:XP_013233626.1 hypothetical protein ETH_00017300 [Eimeria tenella]
MAATLPSSSRHNPPKNPHTPPLHKILRRSPDTKLRTRSNATAPHPTHTTTHARPRPTATLTTRPFNTNPLSPPARKLSRTKPKRSAPHNPPPLHLRAHGPLPLHPYPPSHIQPSMLPPKLPLLLSNQHTPTTHNVPQDYPRHNTAHALTPTPNNHGPLALPISTQPSNKPSHSATPQNTPTQSRRQTPHTLQRHRPTPNTHHHPRTSSPYTRPHDPLLQHKPTVSACTQALPHKTQTLRTPQSAPSSSTRSRPSSPSSIPSLPHPTIYAPTKTAPSAFQPAHTHYSQRPPGLPKAQHRPRTNTNTQQPRSTRPPHLHTTLQQTLTLRHSTKYSDAVPTPNSAHAPTPPPHTQHTPPPTHVLALHPPSRPAPSTQTHCLRLHASSPAQIPNAPHPTIRPLFIYALTALFPFIHTLPPTSNHLCSHQNCPFCFPTSTHPLLTTHNTAHALTPTPNNHGPLALPISTQPSNKPSHSATPQNTPTQSRRQTPHTLQRHRPTPNTQHTPPPTHVLALHPPSRPAPSTQTHCLRLHASSPAQNPNAPHPTIRPLFIYALTGLFPFIHTLPPTSNRSMLPPKLPLLLSNQHTPTTHNVPQDYPRHNTAHALTPTPNNHGPLALPISAQPSNKPSHSATPQNTPTQSRRQTPHTLQRHRPTPNTHHHPRTSSPYTHPHDPPLQHKPTVSACTQALPHKTQTLRTPQSAPSSSTRSRPSSPSSIPSLPHPTIYAPTKTAPSAFQPARTHYSQRPPGLPKAQHRPRTNTNTQQPRSTRPPHLRTTLQQTLTLRHSTKYSDAVPTPNSAHAPTPPPHTQHTPPPTHVLALHPPSRPAPSTQTHSHTHYSQRPPGLPKAQHRPRTNTNTQQPRSTRPPHLHTTLQQTLTLATPQNTPTQSRRQTPHTLQRHRPTPNTHHHPRTSSPYTHPHDPLLQHKPTVSACTQALPHKTQTLRTPQSAPSSSTRSRASSPSSIPSLPHPTIYAPTKTAPSAFQPAHTHYSQRPPGLPKAQHRPRTNTNTQQPRSTRPPHLRTTLQQTLTLRHSTKYSDAVPTPNSAHAPTPPPHAQYTTHTTTHARPRPTPTLTTRSFNTNPLSPPARKLSRTKPKRSAPHNPPPLHLRAHGPLPLHPYPPSHTQPSMLPPKLPLLLSNQHTPTTHNAPQDYPRHNTAHALTPTPNNHGPLALPISTQPSNKPSHSATPQNTPTQSRRQTPHTLQRHRPTPNTHHHPRTSSPYTRPHDPLLQHKPTVSACTQALPHKTQTLRTPQSAPSSSTRSRPSSPSSIPSLPHPTIYAPTKTAPSAFQPAHTHYSQRPP